MRNRAIVIAVNPMPRLYVEALIKELAPTHEVKVLTFYRSPLLSAKLVAKCQQLGAEVNQFSFTTRLTQFTELRRAGRLLRTWLQEDSVDVFHCQPNHLLTNYPTFHSDTGTLGRIRVHLIPDGTANFYHTSAASYRKTMAAKRLVGPMLRLPFHPYRDSYLGLSSAPYTDYWYIRDPGIMRDYMPVREFSGPPARSGTTRAEADWLFVGQPSTGSAFYDDYESLLRSVAARCTGRLHYKLHPAESDTTQWRTRLASLGYAVIADSSASAEEIAQSYGHVAAVASSTLFNLRLMGWHDEVYAVMDVNRLSALTGRSVRELQEVVSAARRMGIRAL